MTKTKMAVLVVVLTTVFALAQYNDDANRYGRYGNGPYQQVQQYGTQNGYRDGYNQGQKDRANNKKYKFKTEDWEDSRGYQNGMGGSKNDYKQAYRAAYQRGYDDAYYGRSGNWPGAYGPYGPANGGVYCSGGDYDAEDCRPQPSGPYNGPYTGPDNRPYPNGGYPNGPYNGPYGGPVYQGGPYNDPAFQIGYNDGYRQGANDAQSQANYNDHGGPYRRATDGYSSQYGDKGAYQQRFRQGYVQGYRAGWSQTAGAYNAPQ